MQFQWFQIIFFFISFKKNIVQEKILRELFNMTLLTSNKILIKEA